MRPNDSKSDFVEMSSEERHPDELKKMENEDV